MGDTIGGYKQPTFPRAWAWQQVTALTKEIGATGVKCAWVGPAWGSEGGKFGKTFDRVRETSEFLANNVAPCTYVVAGFLQARPVAHDRRAAFHADGLQRVG